VTCVRETSLLTRYLASWYILIHRSYSAFKVIGQTSKSEVENLAKVVGATSSEG